MKLRKLGVYVWGLECTAGMLSVCVGLAVIPALRLEMHSWGKPSQLGSAERC